jgi:hypothetical protein
MAIKPNLLSTSQQSHQNLEKKTYLTKNVSNHTQREGCPA